MNNHLDKVATMVSSIDLFGTTWINSKYVGGIIPCYTNMTYPYSYHYYIPWYDLYTSITLVGTYYLFIR
jgi:hypothetical protein